MKKLVKENLVDLVYSQISNMLMNGDLKPGQKVLKKELAAILDVSQTPVNDALTRFVKDGIIEQKDRIGYFVKVYTNEDMKDLFAMRAGLEGVSIRLCIEQCTLEEMNDTLHVFDKISPPFDTKMTKLYQESDRKFHESILLKSGNKIITDFVKNFEFIVKCYQQGLIRPPEETFNEHKAIIKAIQAKDGVKAEQLLMDHHLKTRSRIEEKHLKTIRKL